MAEFLSALAKVVRRNDTTLVEYGRLRPYPNVVPTADPKASLSRGEICRQIQAMLSPDCTLFAETGDSWFNSQLMRPAGRRSLRGGDDLGSHRFARK